MAVAKRKSGALLTDSPKVFYCVSHELLVTRLSSELYRINVMCFKYCLSKSIYIYIAHSSYVHNYQRKNTIK